MGVTVGMVARYIGALLLIIAFVMVLVYILRKFGKGVGVDRLKSSFVRVLNKVPLDAKHTLYVIEVAGRTLLVGATPTEIRLIADLSRGETGEHEPSEFESTLREVYKQPTKGVKEEIKKKLEALKELAEGTK